MADGSEISVQSLHQLEAVYDTLVNCGNIIATKSDNLESLKRDLSRVWEDEKGDEFGDVINALLGLNDEALKQLKQECDKLWAYIEKLRIALGVEVKQ